MSAAQAAELRVIGGSDWTNLATGAHYKLAAEALRIRLAHLFDPLEALHCSMLDPLSHQISAVYESMLERHPLRSLLAGEPGGGKTIMAGLLNKVLQVRGDLKRCIVICPGLVAEHWRDELLERFQLWFRILTSKELNAAVAGETRESCLG